MMKLLSGLPENVVGVDVAGRVEADDYRDVLGPAIASALEDHDKLRLLVVLGGEFEGYSAGAAWEDAKLGIGHWGEWERIAVVTDRRSVVDAIKAVGWLVPGEVKVFAPPDRAEAEAWVGAARGS